MKAAKRNNRRPAGRVHAKRLPQFVLLLAGICICLLGGQAWGAPGFALPDPYAKTGPTVLPAREITFILPAPRTSQDNVWFHTIEPFMSKTSKGVKAQYKPGKGGAYAVNALIGRPSDDYVLAAMFMPGFLLHTYSPSPLFTLNDVEPVAIVGDMPTALWVPEKSAYATVDDFVRTVRSRPEGSTFIGGVGSYSGSEMMTLLFNRAAGIFAEYIPYQSTADCEVSMGRETICAAWGPALRPETARHMRPLAIAARERLPLYPDIPTFAEQGIPVVHSQQIGIFIAKTATQEVKSSLQRFFVRLLPDPELQETLKKNGIAPMVLLGEHAQNFIDNTRPALESFLDEYPMLPYPYVPSIQKTPPAIMEHLR